MDDAPLSNGGTRRRGHVVGRPPVGIDREPFGGFPTPALAKPLQAGFLPADAAVLDRLLSFD